MENPVVNNSVSGSGVPTKWSELEHKHKVFIFNLAVEKYYEYRAERGESPYTLDERRTIADSVYELAKENGILPPKKSLQSHVCKFLAKLLQGRPVIRKLQRWERVNAKREKKKAAAQARRQELVYAD